MNFQGLIYAIDSTPMSRETIETVMEIHKIGIPKITIKIFVLNSNGECPDDPIPEVEPDAKLMYDPATGGKKVSKFIHSMWEELFVPSGYKFGDQREFIGL